MELEFDTSQSVEDLKRIMINSNEDVWKQVESNTFEINSTRQQLRVIGHDLDRLK